MHIDKQLLVSTDPVNVGKEWHQIMSVISEVRPGLTNVLKMIWCYNIQPGVDACFDCFGILTARSSQELNPQSHYNKATA